MKITKILMTALAALFFAACSNDDEETLRRLDLNIDYGTISTSNVSNLQITIQGAGVNRTCKVSDFANYYGKCFELPEGNYTITATGKVKDNNRATIVGSTNVALKSDASQTIALSLDYDYTLKTLTFDESSWSAYIDNPQYYGSQLYSEGYTWTDATTQLKSTSYGSDWGFFWPDAFEAVSNYVSTDISANGTYNQQLTVYGEGGHSGKNFCVHFGYDSGYASGISGLKFVDGKARQFESMWVNNTTYFLNVVENGDASVAAAGKNDTVYVNVLGYNGANQVSSMKINLFIDGKAVKKWTKIDLTSLGKVTEVRFDMGGTVANSYGFAAPAYFAYDDVAVRFDK